MSLKLYRKVYLNKVIITMRSKNIDNKVRLKIRLYREFLYHKLDIRIIYQRQGTSRV